MEAPKPIIRISGKRSYLLSCMQHEVTITSRPTATSAASLPEVKSWYPSITLPRPQASPAACNYTAPHRPYLRRQHVHAAGIQHRTTTHMHVHPRSQLLTKTAGLLPLAAAATEAKGEKYIERSTVFSPQDKLFDHVTFVHFHLVLQAKKKTSPALARGNKAMMTVANFWLMTANKSNRSSPMISKQRKSLQLYPPCFKTS